MERIDTVVIGAGQAGLAASFHLTHRGIEHVVLERRRVADSWRTRRWDSFTLVGPNWSFTLPGRPYGGLDPDGFMHRDKIVAAFESYARSIRAPVREGVTVTRVGRAAPFGLVVQTEGSAIFARSVIVAAGPYQRPKIPPSARQLDTKVLQIHSDEYRSSGRLPDGAVLVVGSGQSGCQIAEDLRSAGRTVYLSTGGTGWYPRRYRGKDNMTWRQEMGFFEHTVDTIPATQRLASVPIQTGKDGGHDLNLRVLAAQGVVLAGRFVSADRTGLRFAPDLEMNMKRSDQVARALLAKIDDFIVAEGVGAPRERGDLFFTPPIVRVGHLDVKRDSIGAIVWATGYELAFGWVDIPVFDRYGYPIQRQGVTDVEGLYFLGLHWMHTRKSGIILGAGADAQHVVDHIDSRSDARVARTA